MLGGSGSAAATLARPLSRLGVSARIVLTLVLITTVGLLLASVVAQWADHRVLEQRVDRSLAQEVDELRTLAAGQDPLTGLPFADVDALLSTVISRNVPDEHEGFLVTIDGDVPFVPSWQQRPRLEELPQLREIAAGTRATDGPRLDTIVIDDRELRYLVLPVTVTGDSAEGVFMVARDLSAERQDLDQGRQVEWLAMGGTLVLMGIVSGLAITRLLRPLRRLAQTAERITEEDLSERIPEEGADDLARMTRTVNRMLDRLDQAFQGQRSLLDDVGHELRTPLTVIRGHLELMESGEPHDVEATRALVLDEIDRMTRLVEELVLLAKSTRPDFLSLEQVSLDTVVTGVHERARALGDRGWRIDATSPVVVRADEQRLVQAVLQLVSNAIRHTRPGDDIGIGCSVDQDQAHLWVRDTGDGVPLADQERIFERFERGSRPDHADGDGSGLGLSIVSAVAAAHGGAVRVWSTPGAGATFCIDLPISPPEEST